MASLCGFASFGGLVLWGPGNKWVGGEGLTVTIAIDFSTVQYNKAYYNRVK